MPDLAALLLSPWGGIAAVLLVEASAIALVRWGQLRRGMTPAVARKALHVATSAVALALPWLFADAWPVVLLAAAGVAVGLLSRAWPRLRRAVGPTLRATGAETVGDLAFPVAVAVLFVLAGAEPVLYAIPLLLLGLADPAAALAGEAEAGTAPRREAAVAFAAVAFLCVHVPLLVFTPVGRAESLWVAAIVAVLVTLLRAVSWRGLDNLFVPLGAYAVLLRLLTLPAPRLAGHALALGVLVGTAALLRRASTVGGAGVYGVALVAYLLWALGGTAWLLTPGLFYVLYDRVWPGGGLARAGQDRAVLTADARPHTAHNVFSVAAVGMAWLVASRALDAELLAPFCLAWGVSFGFTGVERMRLTRPRWSAARMGWEAAWRGVLITAAPLALVWGLRVLAGTPGAPASLAGSLGTAAAVSALAIGGAAAILARWGRVIDDESSPFMGRAYRAALVLPASALGLAAVW